MFFLWFWGRPGRSMGWAHMQSARACAVETHFFVFAFFLKIRLHMTSFWFHFGTVFRPQSQFWVKKRAPKNGSKKGDPPVANARLWTSQEAPGGRHTIKNCSSKKQLFEHMLKQLFEFLLENVNWDENWIQNRKLFHINFMKYLNFNCCSNLVIWHALGKGPANSLVHRNSEHPCTAMLPIYYKQKLKNPTSRFRLPPRPHSSLRPTNNDHIVR